jgi:hypothetical protein
MLLNGKPYKAAEEGPIIIPQVLEVAKTGNDAVRLCAIRILRQLADKTTTQQLCAILKSDPYAEARGEAAYALARIGDPSATDTLIAAIQDSHKFVRSSALESLCALDEAKTNPAINEILIEENAISPVSCYENFPQPGCVLIPSGQFDVIVNELRRGEFALGLAECDEGATAIPRLNARHELIGLSPSDFCAVTAMQQPQITMPSGQRINLTTDDIAWAKPLNAKMKRSDFLGK